MTRERAPARVCRRCRHPASRTDARCPECGARLDAPGNRPTKETRWGIGDPDPSSVDPAGERDPSGERDPDADWLGRLRRRLQSILE